MTTMTSDRAHSRLRSSSLVSEVLHHGRRRAQGAVVVHVRLAEGSEFRFTTVASRRVGDAVRRNRAKRLMREAVRSMAWQPGTDAVVVARPSIDGAGLAKVRADVEAAGQALGALV